MAVNNVGYGLFGMVEEITEQQLRDQLETNLFGVAAAVGAAVPASWIGQPGNSGELNTS